MLHTAYDVVTPARTIEELRAWQTQARYPELLIEAPARAGGVIYRRIREGTELVVTALRHVALTPSQAHALAEFRLQQYVLCGWYNLEALDRREVTTDPAFEHLPWNTVHVLAGTSSGQLLAYFCMQPASAVSTAHDLASIGIFALDGDYPRPRVMGDARRPLFPTEIHSFSRQIFASLPALRNVPVHRVRELTRLLRNQTTHSLLSAIAVVEAICAMTAVAMNPECEIAIMLGCVDREAREVTAHLGIPILFAPLAPTIPRPPVEDEFYWAARANEQGRFWPFVIASEDLTPLASWFGDIDAMLAGSARDVRRGIVELGRRAPAAQPHSLARDLRSSSVLWTGDLLFDPQQLATPDSSSYRHDATPIPLRPPEATPSGRTSRPARRRSARRANTQPRGRRHRSRRQSKRRSRRAMARRPATRAPRRRRR